MSGCNDTGVQGQASFNLEHIFNKVKDLNDNMTYLIRQYFGSALTEELVLKHIIRFFNPK